MPFLRAALIKRKKLEPAIERVKVVLTPAVEEQEPEEEFSPTQIEDLHRLIDIRTEEAEQAEHKEQEIPIEPVIVVVPEIVTEPEIVTLEAETVPEILEPELQPEIADIESTPEILETELQPEITETESTPEILEPELTPEIPDIETLPETEQSPELLTEIIIEPEDFTPEAEIEILPEADTVTEEITEPELTPEIPQEEPSLEDIPEIEAPQDFDENSLLDEPEQSGTPEIEPLITLEPEPEIIPEPEPEITEPESEPEITEPETESEPEISQPEKSHKDYSGSHLDYDFTSGERYVDKVSTKTEFDKMLDELSAISKELLSWQTDKFARDYTVKFSEGESSQADARKYEAFLGGYITNAAMMLYDKGYRDAAIKQLEQAISILQARKKLEDETSAIKSRVEEQNDAVDLSDILGLFGDG
ncbi:MAG: hypothetical protein IJG36_04105 [Synergistaceae bacterium]|nr:hypothetical protein [Synergistaceae bacterium]